MKKKVVISILIGVVALVAIIVGVNIINKESDSSKNSKKIEIVAGDSKLTVTKDGQVYCNKFDTYLLNYDNKRIKAKYILVGNFNGCYIVDREDNLYNYDLSGNIFYSKSMYENQKYISVTEEYNGFGFFLENVGGGYTQTSIREDLTTRYDLYSSTEYDLINNTSKKF